MDEHYKDWTPIYTAIECFSPEEIRRYDVYDIKSGSVPGNGIMFARRGVRNDGPENIFGFPCNPKSGKLNAIGIRPVIGNEYIELVGVIRPALREIKKQFYPSVLPTYLCIDNDVKELLHIVRWQLIGREGKMQAKFTLEHII